jgi:peptidoglycan/xylan/chitin deacetylase (PgdA/CDA1 family)
VSLCRADKVLLAGGAAILGSATLFGATPLSLGVPLAALAGVIADGVFRPSSGILYPTISHGSREIPKVALTFDDGPDPEITPQVLDTLARHRARATFFMIGRNLSLPHGSAVAARVLAEGHEIGNHSWQHAYTQNFFSQRRHLEDMARNEQLIRELTNSDAPIAYRPPVGLKSPEFARAAHRRQAKVIAWSVHSRDTIDSNPKRVATRVLRRIRPGDIVLFHDGHQTPGARRHSGANALPYVLEGLRERGLEPVTIRELLGAKP